jgi:hypothetical protein
MGLTQNDAVLARALPRLFGGTGRSGSAAFPSGVQILRGRDVVAARRDLLINLCMKTGQSGAVDALDVSLDKPASRAKIPYLVLVGSSNMADWGTVSADDLDGAVLIYEYKLARCATGIFATDNVNGEGTVIAPDYFRTDVAEQACQTLLDRGARMILMTLEGKTLARGAPGSRADLPLPSRMSTRTRKVPYYLPLGRTLDSTFAAMGKHTRRNLRYYRKRLELELGAVFEPRVVMDRAQFLEFNRASMYPAAEEVAAWRYDAMIRTTDSFFAGVKAHDGRWLSLIGGRRHGPTTEIDWQMNLAGLSRFSLSTAMRSFMLEHEIERGMKQLLFVGGTPHSMRHAFVDRDVVDLIVHRRSVIASLLPWLLPRRNFLGQALNDKTLRWIDW